MTSSELYHDSYQELEVGRTGLQVEEYRGSFRIRVPARYTWDGKPKVIYTDVGVNDEWGNSIAWRWVEEMERDMDRGIFDSTLKKYQPKPKKAPLELVTRNNPKKSLLEIWDAYSEFRKPQVAVTTYERNYRGRFRNIILELPSDKLTDAIAIRDFLLNHHTTNTTKRSLVQFNAACKWAVKSGLIKQNPFEGMAGDIRVKRNNSKIDPFTAEERNAIIAAFEAHPHHKHYAPFVKFLFWTGARTSEAVALQWKDVNPGCTQIVFSSAIVRGVRKSTKTDTTRKFPCNQQLQQLLKSIRPADAKPEDLVFTNPEGNHINSNTFMHNSWGGDSYSNRTGIVQRLADEGKIDRYRPQYQTRSTFITSALQSGVSIPQLARWTGHSSETLLRHYGGVTVSYLPPEF